MPRAIRALRLLAVTLAVAMPISGTTGSVGPTKPVRAHDVLPAEGLVPSSIAVLRDQKTLDAHYYLADEDILGLGRGTDAVIARYEAGTGEALLLVVVYPNYF